MPDPAPLPAPLVDGFGRFRAGRFEDERERYRRLAEHGQRPAAMLVACSDSRSAPETVFDASPGELFVVRNIAGWIPPYRRDREALSTGAALEYAIRVLPIETIVVMGHGGCGGVRAAIDPGFGPPTSEFVGTWIRDIAALARDLATRTPAGELQHAVELGSVERSLANLATYPWIAERVADGSLALAGAWFAIASGELDTLGPDGWTRVEAD